MAMPTCIMNQYDAWSGCSGGSNSTVCWPAAGKPTWDGRWTHPKQGRLGTLERAANELLPPSSICCGSLPASCNMRASLTRLALPFMVLAARANLPDGFAFRLAEAHGTGTPDEASRNPGEAAFQATIPDGIQLIVFRNGIVLFNFAGNNAYCGGSTPAPGGGPISSAYDAAEKERRRIASARTDYMNAFLATLWAGGQEATYGVHMQPSVHIGNYLFAEWKNGTWLITGDSPPVSYGGWIPVEVFKKASEIFSSIYACFHEKTLELLPLLHVAVVHYSNLQFSSSLLIGWSIVEALQNRLWAQTISAASVPKGGHTVINAERRKRLQGRDYTASVVSQTLSLMGKIDDSRLAAMDAARSARNKFAHELATISPDSAALPLSTAASMIAEEAGCPFRMSAFYFSRV